MAIPFFIWEEALCNINGRTELTGLGSNQSLSLIKQRKFQGKSFYWNGKTRRTQWKLFAQEETTNEHGAAVAAVRFYQLLFRASVVNHRCSNIVRRSSPPVITSTHEASRHVNAIDVKVGWFNAESKHDNDARLAAVKRYCVIARKNTSRFLRQGVRKWKRKRRMSLISELIRLRK